MIDHIEKFYFTTFASYALASPLYALNLWFSYQTGEQSLLVAQVAAGLSVVGLASCVSSWWLTRI